MNILIYIYSLGGVISHLVYGNSMRVGLLGRVISEFVNVLFCYVRKYFCPECESIIINTSSIIGHINNTHKGVEFE